MIRTRGKFASYGEVWFDEEITKPIPDILIYRQSVRPIPNVKCKPFRSLVTDLSANEDNIWNELDRGCRYEVRRAAKDNTTCQHISAPSVQDVNEFVDFFNNFARAKSLLPANDVWLLAARTEERISLSNVKYQGEILVWHAHLITGHIARLYHSCSLRQTNEAEKRQMIGRANRLLHWRDLLVFKQRGFHIHDWGGIFFDETDAEQKNVNDFKRKFGGKERDYFDCVLPASVLGNLNLSLRRVLSR